MRPSIIKRFYPGFKESGSLKAATIGLARFRSGHVEMIPWRDMRAIGAATALDRLLGDVQCGDADRIGDLGEHPAHRTEIATLMGGYRDDGHAFGRDDGKV